ICRRAAPPSSTSTRRTIRPAHSRHSPRVRSRRARTRSPSRCGPGRRSTATTKGAMRARGATAHGATPRGATARFVSDRAFWVLLGVAGAVRLFAVAWLWDTAPYSDYFYYHEAGRLQSLDWAFFFHRSTVSSYAKLNWWPPGYPVFLGILYSIAGPNPRVAALGQVVLGVVTCGLVAAAGARAAGRRVGLTAGWLLALDPTYVFTTNLVASENL